MHLTSLQFALFFSEPTQRPDLDFSDLSARLKEFNTIPTTIPLPIQIPADVPVVIHKSADGEFNCNIARSRIDLFCQRISEEKSNSDILRDFNNLSQEFSRYVIEKKPTSRFGLICNYFYSVNDSVTTLKNKYLRSDSLDIDELGIRFNSKSSSNHWTINDLVNLNTGFASIFGAEEAEGIVIQRDINNQPIENKTIQLETLKRISIEYSNLLSENSIRELVA